MSGGQRSSPTKSPYAPPALLVLQTTLFLIDHFVNFKPLWVDEGYSALLARRTFAEINQALVYDAGPPLYYYLLHVWRMAFGESELALRSLSLVFGLIATALIYRFAKRWLSPTAAFYAALIWALHPQTLFYMAQARNYTLMAALAVWYADCLLRYLHEPKFKPLALISIAVTMSVYNHNIAWFIAAAGGLSSLYFSRAPKRIFILFIAHLVPGLLYFPWLPVMQQQMANTHLTIAWIEDIWTVFAPLLSIFFLSIGFTLNHFTHAWTLALIAPLVFIWPAVLTASGRAANKSQKHILLWLLLICFLMVFGPWLQSVFSVPTYIILRTDFVTLPFLSIAASLGLRVWLGGNRFKKTVAVVSITLPMLVYTLVGVGSERGPFPEMGNPMVSEKAIADYIQRQGKPGDVLVCTDVTRPVLEYYLAPNGFKFGSFPPDMNLQLAHYNGAWYRENLDLEEEAGSTIQTAKQMMNPGATLWAVTDGSPVNRPLENALQSDSELFGSPNPIGSPRMGIRMLGARMYILRYEQR